MKQLALLLTVVSLSICLAPKISLGQDDPNAWKNVMANLPATEFPNVPAEKKSLDELEKDWSEKVTLYSSMIKEKGQYYTLNQFKDCSSYLPKVKENIPSVKSRRKAFVLYLCWKQASLAENNVTLEKLDAKEALVKVKPLHLQVYEKANLKEQISIEDYKRIFQTIWETRAAMAGWDLVISYEGNQCILNFTKSPKPFNAWNRNRTIEELYADLECPDIVIQRQAISRLGRKRDPAALDVLIYALKNNKDPFIRKDAAFAMGKIGNPKAVDALIEALNDQEPKVRCNSSWALGKINDNRAVQPLINLLARDKHEEVVPAVTTALMTITMEMLGEDPNEWQKWWQENKDKYQNQ